MSSDLIVSSGKLIGPVSIIGLIDLELYFLIPGTYLASRLTLWAVLHCGKRLDPLLKPLNPQATVLEVLKNSSLILKSHSIPNMPEWRP